MLHEDCKIESLETGKRKIVHSNSLRPFAYEAQIVDEEHKLLDESDDSDLENLVYIPKEPLVYNREETEQEQERYNLRRNRRQPDRYGLPIYEF